MVQILSSLALLLGFSSVTFAKDLGFRFTAGKCVDAAGKSGLNPGYIGQCGDLRNVVIARFTFDDSDLSGSSFEGSDLQGSSMRNCNLTNVIFKAANLSGVDLEGSMIHNADFNMAILVNGHFAGAEFINPDFSGADLSGSLLSYMKFPGANFAGANLGSAVMDHVDLSGLNLSGVSFRGVNLQNSVLDKTMLSGANFAGADLTLATFVGAKGPNISFADAILRKTIFDGASLQSSNFKNTQMDSASLNNVDFQKSDMRGAVLKGATIKGAKFKDVTFNKRSVLPFTMEEAKAIGMVFLPAPSILAWTSFADKDAGPNGEAQNTLRTIRLQVPDIEDADVRIDETLDYAAIAGKLKDATVFLIPEMENGSDAVFAAKLGAPLKAFINGGGLVIAMRNNSFLKDSGLMNTVEKTCISDGVLLPVLLPTHALATGLGASIVASNATCSQTVVDAGVEFIVGDKTNAYVFAKKMGKGMIVGIGYDMYEHNADADKILGNAVRLAY